MAGLLFPGLAGAAGATPPPAQFEDSFRVGDDTFVLKAKRRFVELAYTDGEKIELSVFRNGKLIQAEDASGGTIIACRQSFTTPNDRNPIERLIVSGERKGWWISAGGCGARSMKTHAAILPPLKAEQSTYQIRVIKSDWRGVFARKTVDGDDIEFWSFKYYEDCGAWTISYPTLDVLAGRSRLPQNPGRWPKVSDFPQADANDNASIYPADYVTRFIAAIANKDTALLKTTLSAFDKGSAPVSPFPKECRPKILPGAKKDLQRIITAFETLDRAGILASELIGIER
jgi:hypothetical protein